MAETKIVSIYYTKPGMSRDANGEAVYYRYGCWVTVNEPAPYSDKWLKKVISILWDEDLRQFMVYFDKGGFKTIPYLPDTEVTYEYVTQEKKKNVSK